MHDPQCFEVELSLMSTRVIRAEFDLQACFSPPHLLPQILGMEMPILLIFLSFKTIFLTFSFLRLFQRTKENNIHTRAQ